MVTPLPPSHPLYHAELSPDKPAWIFNEHVTTYQELGVNLLKGAQLLRKLGLQTGDGIVVLAENHPDTLALYWAAQTAGLYYTPISTQFQTAEVEHILNDCDAKLLITSDTQAGKTTSAPQPQRLSIENWLRAISSESEHLINDACEGAEMLYSSGTTGHPKGVRAAHPGGPLGRVPELFTRRLSLHEIDSTAVYLSTAPLYHSAPLRYNAMMHRCGATSVIMERFEATQSLALIEKHRITHSQWVPTMFVRLLRLPQDDRRIHDLSSHRFAIHAAAPCPVEIKRQMLDWWGPILYEYYSGTEGNGQTAISPAEWLEHPGSVGKPILGKLHITNDAGEELECGETGAVYFSGGLEFEYYQDPEKTAAAYNHRGWSTLGDIGYLDAAGYLYLTDRASHMIISGGVNIYPREIEDVLVTHPAVQDVAVFGIPHEEFGEEVKAAVQLVEGEEVAAETLIAFCRARLAHLKCPSSIDFHTELPRHQTGKLYKEVLKTPYWPKHRQP